MKAYQLRVRLDAKQHEELLNMSSVHGKDETLSDIVRKAINLYLLPPTSPAEDAEFAIAPEIKCTVRQLAKELERKPARVLEDCVEGIIDIMDRKRAPLIVLELELRQKFNAERALKVHKTTPTHCREAASTMK